MSPTAKAILAKVGLSLAWIAIVLAALLAAVFFADVIDVALGHTEGYPWGWEGGGWPYRTPRNYILSGMATGAICAAFTVGLVLSRRQVVRFSLIFGLFVVFVAGLPRSTIAEATGFSWGVLLP